MKRLLTVLLFFVIGTQAFAQGCYHLDLISHWRYGPCKAVAVNPGVYGIFVGDGAQIDILDTPYMHPWQDRIVTRGVVEQIIIANNLAYVLQSRDAIGIYKNFASPNGEELSYLELKQPLRRMFLVDSSLFLTSDSGLILVDVSEPYTPKIAGQFAYLGYGMAAKDSILYVGRSVLNIKDPRHPVLLDTLQTDGQMPYRMKVYQHYLYVVTKEPGVPLCPIAVFFIFDITDPAHPQLLFNKPMDDFQFNKALSLTVNDSLACIGFELYDVVATSNIGNDLKGTIKLVDIKDKYNPLLLSSFEVFCPLDLQLRGSKLLVANGAKGFLKLNINDPLQISEIESYRTAGASSNVFVQDGRAYLCAGGAVKIFDVSDEQQLQFLGSIDSIPSNASIEPQHIFNAQAVFKKSGENTLFLMDEHYGLFELQANDSMNFWDFTVLRFLPTDVGKYFAFSPDSNIIYASDGIYGLDVIDLNRMEIVKKYDSNPLLDVAAEDTLLAVSVEDKGVDVYGCRQPDNPKLLATISKSKPVTSLLVHDSYLFLTEYYAEENESVMEVYHWPDDVLKPESAKILHLKFKGKINDLAVLGFDIFAADLTCGVRHFTFVPDDTLYGECLAQTYGQPTALYGYRIFHEKVPDNYLFLADGEDGLYRYHWTVGVGLPGSDSNVPEGFVLKQNYPNPFNGQTMIRYHLNTAGKVELTVFNVLGQKIKTLINGKQSAGEHQVLFDADNLPSGVYVYRLMTGKRRYVKKMVLLR